jgi:hypothetical protein
MVLGILSIGYCLLDIVYVRLQSLHLLFWRLCTQWPVPQSLQLKPHERRGLLLAMPWACCWLCPGSAVGCALGLLSVVPWVYCRVCSAAVPARAFVPAPVLAVGRAAVLTVALAEPVLALARALARGPTGSGVAASWQLDWHACARGGRKSGC